MTLRNRFNLTMLFILLVAAAGVGGTAYYAFQRQAESEASRTGSLMMETALAIRGYTSKHIKPELDPLLEQRFLPQTVPGFSAMETLSALKTKFPDYSYKEATPNPTNPRDLALPWEKDIVDRFVADGGLTELSGKTRVDGKDIYYTARPIRIKDAACLRCHSDSAIAPKTMVAVYGDQAGFGWQLNQIIGAQIVTVPVQVPEAQARQGLLAVLVGLGLIFVLLFGAVALVLSSAVLRPLRELREYVDHLGSVKELFGPDITIRGASEFKEFGNAFNRMKTRLMRATVLEQHQRRQARRAEEAGAGNDRPSPSSSVQKL